MLLLRYHKTEDEERQAELRVRVKEVVSQQFECKQQRHEMEIRDLEQRIVRLRKRLEKATTNREKLVERALERLLSEPPPERMHRGKGRDHGKGRRGHMAPPPEHDGLEPSPED